MKIVFISDTHGQHKRLRTPECDVLVHAGDFTPRGELPEVVAFLSWFEEQPAKRKILVAGNHDIFCERNAGEFNSMLPAYPSISYLCNSGIEIEGKTFWGSPVTPKFYDWAFMMERYSDEIRQHWDRIPNDLYMLITHGPPAYIMDSNAFRESVGCFDLRLRVMKAKPKIHVFGHIHECGGRVGSHKDMPTTFINAASLDGEYKNIRPPIVLEDP